MSDHVNHFSTTGLPDRAEGGSMAPRVLCVDDEPCSLSTVARVLKRHVRVTGCGSAEEALALLEVERDFAVVIADLRMPGMSGDEFLEAVKRLRPGVTRLVMTGSDESGLKLGPDTVFRWIGKPCSAEDLLEAVSAAVAHHHAALGIA